MATSSEKLENCEVCAAERAKYTCPKCEVRTCSLTCVNIHKKELECDGIRDRTKFIPLNSFTDLDLLSDYRLLEEVGRSVDQLQRDPSKGCTRININLPVPLQKLRAAAHRSGVRLEFMPRNFSRHKENTTFFNWKSNELFWRIEWIFPQAENTKWITKRVHERERLSDVVESILDPTNSKQGSEDQDSNSREILHERLQFYRAAELTGIKVLLKAEKVKKSNSRFHELDLTLSLKDNLARKTIIEYPIVHIVLKDHLDMYEIVDSDDEETAAEQPLKNGDRRGRGDQRQSRREKPAKKEPLNYFFNTEYSDSDEENKNQWTRSKRAPRLDVPNYDELVRMEH